jgi:mono/diheme cytochrome c family protein
MKWTKPLLFCLILSACLQTENSSSLDADMVGNEEYVKILVNNCGSCHGEVLLTDEALVDIGWVIPGDPENSKIYYRLWDSEGLGGPKNMPPSGSLLPSDVQAIRSWIENL